MTARLDDDRLLPRTPREWRTFVRDGWREGLFLAGVVLWAWLWVRAFAWILP